MSQELKFLAGCCQLLRIVQDLRRGRRAMAAASTHRLAERCLVIHQSPLRYRQLIVFQEGQHGTVQAVAVTSE